MRSSAALVIVASLCLLLLPVGAAQDSSDYRVTQSTNTVYFGDGDSNVYAVEASDSRCEVRDTNETPEYVAVVTRDDTNAGFVSDTAVFDSGGSGRFSFDLPTEPHPGDYRAIVVSSGCDGTFGTSNTASSLESLVRNNPQWTYSQLEETLRAETAGEAGSDDVISVLSFEVVERRTDVTIDDLDRNVVVGDTLSITGRLEGRFSENVEKTVDEITVEINQLNTPTDSTSMRTVERWKVPIDPDDEEDFDGRWDLADVDDLDGSGFDTEGYTLGRYRIEAFSRNADVGFDTHEFQIVSENYTEVGEAEMRKEPIFTPETFGNQGSQNASPPTSEPYDATPVAELDSLDLGERTTVVAKVESTSERAALVEFWASDGTRQDPSYPPRQNRRQYFRGVLRPDFGLSVEEGEWYILDIVRISSFLEEVDGDTVTGGDDDAIPGSEEIRQSDPFGTFQAVDAVPVGDSHYIRVDRDEVEEFVGARVVFDSYVKYIKESVAGEDDVYLDGGDNTVLARDVHAGQLRLAENYTVLGRVSTEEIQVDDFEVFSPYTVGEGAATHYAVSVRGAAFLREGARGGLSIPGNLGLLDRYTMVNASEATSIYSRRTAFNASVVKVGETRGVEEEESTDRAVVRGEDGTKLVIEYPSTIDLAAGNDILVKGVVNTGRTSEGLPTIRPRGIGIYSYSETDTQAVVESSPSNISFVDVDHPSEVNTADSIIVNLTSRNTGGTGFGSHSLTFPSSFAVSESSSSSGLDVSYTYGSIVVTAEGDWESNSTDTLSVEATALTTGEKTIQYSSGSTNRSFEVEVEPFEQNFSTTSFNPGSESSSNSSVDVPTPPESVVFFDSGNRYVGKTDLGGESYYIFEYNNTNPLGNRLEVVNSTGSRVSNSTVATQAVRDVKNTTGADGGWSSLNITRLKVVGAPLVLILVLVGVVSRLR
ncbi:hypothetical protein ACEU6E_00540 [Halorutilales archaeon Cl-col2-1]